LQSTSCKKILEKSKNKNPLIKSGSLVNGFLFVKIMKNEVEIWRDVPSYEGHYQVSSFGNVKSIKCWHGADEIILKSSPNGRGYLSVKFYKEGKLKTFTIHVLVAIAFHGHVPDGTLKIVVDHKDNNKLNNRADNLRLTTNRDNCTKDTNGTSKFAGVCFVKDKSRWYAKIQFNGICIHLGSFELEIDAANAYQKALGELNDGLDLSVLYPKRIKTSKYEGVYWDKSRNMWAARYSGKYIGRFNTEMEAYEARENYIAKLNILV
jgi:hypothetical protein